MSISLLIALLGMVPRLVPARAAQATVCSSTNQHGAVEISTDGVITSRDSQGRAAASRRLLSSETISRCAIDPTGTYAAVAPGTAEATFDLFNLRTAKLIRIAEKPSSGVFSMAFSGDGRWIATGEADRVARLWSVETGVEQEVYRDHPQWVDDLRFSENGRCLTTYSRGDRSVWETTTGRLLGTINRGSATGSGDACSPWKRGPREPALRLIVIGINRYDHPKWRLSAARGDAVAISHAFSREGDALYRHVPPVKLLDGAANRVTIRHALEQLAIESGANDVVVIYYSGHGLVDNGRFFLLPADMPPQTDPESLIDHALPADELMTALMRVKAKRVALILDACESGAAMPVLTERVRASITRGAKDGFHLLAASSDISNEVRDLGHGIMTYALLQFLGEESEGKAEKPVTVAECFRAVQTQVHELTRRFYPGRRQEVTVWSSGVNFPLVLKP